MPRQSNQNIQTAGLKITGIEKRGLNPNPKARIPQRPAPPQPRVIRRRVTNSTPRNGNE